ncbi:unnamed protein product [Symbiodinium sp. CCMP2592]|nr:unnamed protein product [Symbiodinium sp. CCMP2592]
MLQIQAPAEIFQLIQANHAVNNDATSAQDIQANVHQVALELEARTQRLAACVSSLTGDLESVKLQTSSLLYAAQTQEASLTSADGVVKDMANHIQQLERVVAQVSRSQVTFESTMGARLEAIERDVKALYGSSESVDALRSEVASMKVTLASLETRQGSRDDDMIHESLKQYVLEECMSKNDGLDWSRRLMDLQVEQDKLRSSLEASLASHEAEAKKTMSVLESMVAYERTTSTLQQRYDEISKQLDLLSVHLNDGRVREQANAPRQPAPMFADKVSQQSSAEPTTPRIIGSSRPERYNMTPEAGKDLSSEQVDMGWYDDDEDNAPLSSLSFGPSARQTHLESSPPGLPKSARKQTEVSSSAWKLLKDMPKLNSNASEAWEQGVHFRQWTTEVAAVAEAIHPNFADFFRRRLDEGQRRYEKRMEQGFSDPVPAAQSVDKEFETRLSLTLLKLLPNKIKTHALERGNTQDGISTIVLLESIYEQMTPGGIREKNSLLQYLRTPPVANHGEELTATLRRYRLAMQRAAHLAIPALAAHESIAALDLMVKPLEKKHQALSVRLGIMRLQSNIQIPTPEGVEVYMKVLEAEAMKLQAEEAGKPRSASRSDGGDEYSIPSANQVEGKGTRPLCAYFNTARGCLKGSACTFRHEKSSGGDQKGKGAKGKDGKDGGKPGKGGQVTKPEPKGDTSDSDIDNLSVSGIPMRADGQTPDWSEVERGEFSSEESESDGSDEILNLQRQPEPLWTLDLSFEEYVVWSRSGHVQAQAHRAFRQVTNPNAIDWPIWWTILHDQLDEDERGVIPVVEGVDMLRCDVVQIMFEDDVARPVFVIWLIEQETGRERHIAIVRHQQRPRVNPWPESGMSQAASSSSHQGAQGAHSHSDTASVGLPRMGYPITPLAKAAAFDIRSSDRQAFQVAQATAEVFEVHAEFPSHDSGGEPDDEQGSPRSSAISSGGDVPTAMRCIALEDCDDIPSLVGAKKTNIAARLECIDQPTGSTAAVPQVTMPSVLVDSGANETIRPWTSDIKESGGKRTTVVTASGDHVPAVKTRDGELCIQASPSSRDWLLSVRRLVDAGGAFSWNQSGATVTYLDQHGRHQTIECLIQNGLPFLSWQDFRPIRIMLSRFHKAQTSSALLAKAGGDDEGWVECDTCTLEQLMQDTWNEETMCAGVEFTDEVLKSETLAREVLAKGSITYEELWEVVRNASLPMSSRRAKMWIFGYYCHGGIVGITNLTRQRPNLCKLVNAFIRQELPGLTYATFQIAIDATLTPHRDLTNEVSSKSGVIGLTKFTGGRLWIEDSHGMVKRRIVGDEIKVGNLLEVSRQAHTFNARQWHGADKHRGVRGIVTCYTPRCLDKGDIDTHQCLCDLGFNLPPQQCKVCGVTLLTPASEPVDPWIACALEEKSLASSFDEAARQRAVQLLQSKCSKGLYERHCPKCSESAGHKRKSRRLTAEDVARGTLSLDLSGPHPHAFSGHRYFMVANLSVDGDDLPFSRLLYTKQSSEVAKALNSVMCQIISLVQGTPSVFRIHSDAGKEFVGGAFQKEVESCSLWPTRSAPYNPQQNGRAERLVGILKQAAASLLLHAQLPLQLWDEAILEATFLRRCRALKLVIPKDRPHMGDTVLLRKPVSPDTHPFAPKAEEGIFLANDERTPGGARVMVVRDGGTAVRVARMPVLVDKQSPRWRLEKGPQDQVVWISTCGDVCWDAPPADLITVEEATGAVQAWNDGNTASDIIKQRFKEHLKPELLFSLFGHGFLVEPEPSGPIVAANGEHTESFQEECKDNWYRVFDADTEDAMNEMEVALRLLAEEEVTGEPVPSSIFFTGSEQDRQPWIKAAGDEVSNMVTNTAWVEVNINRAREELGIGPHQRLPKVLPMTVVCTRKPLLMQGDKCDEKSNGESESKHKQGSASQSADEVKASEQKRFKPKVRLCVCGNFEEVKPGMKDANAAETVPIEVLRLMLTLLAMHVTWAALSLDISAAFLNAVLTGSDIILMQPPKSLVKLGLIAEGVWLRALRAIYGLRQSPARWEEHRDSILSGAILEPAAGDELPVLVIEAMKGIGGVFLIKRRDTQELVAVACVFVDDVLAIGETEAILRIGEFILKSWKGKLQGMISRDANQKWTRGSLEVMKKPELVFVGIQVFFHDKGVATSQQRWVVKQLNLRGYLHLNGSPCLPQVEEGKISKGNEQQCEPKILKQAQRELGTLMWLATKTRPDIAATCGILSTMIVLRPDMVLQKVVGMWKYIRYTMFFGMWFAANSCNSLSLESDASFGSGASRSRSGYLVKWGGNTLMYKSTRQTLTAFSTCEAETAAMADALADMLRLECYVTQLGEVSEMLAEGDNAASIASLTKPRFQETLWRTRHFGLRASWIRDVLKESGIALSHKAGSELTADLLTKTLPRLKLEQFRRAIGVCRVHDDNIHVS